MKFTNREHTIMQEAFITGRIYNKIGEVQKPSEINNILVRNCERAVKVFEGEIETTNDMETDTGRIICGFAGIGKSTLAKNKANYVDLESTPFGKDWDRYIKVAVHMSNNGYNVLLSCHKELREKLQSRNINYILAIPLITSKEEYIQRYKNRKNTKEFIQLLNDNWNTFLNVLPNEKVFIVHDYLENELLRWGPLSKSIHT